MLTLQRNHVIRVLMQRLEFVRYVMLWVMWYWVIYDALPYLDSVVHDPGQNYVA